jgi:hypothetical protein
MYHSDEVGRSVGDREWNGVTALSLCSLVRGLPMIGREGGLR